MADKFLHREDAPLSSQAWERIDFVVTEAAKSQLSARRLIHIEGPYGLGFKTMPGPDQVLETAAEREVEVVSSAARPMALIRKTFRLSARDIAASEQQGVPLDAGVIAQTAIACARQEEDILYNGSKALGVAGLMNAKGTQSLELNSWDETGRAADDIIAAATKLDEAGYHGPYALGLAPARYNLLFRLYPQGHTTELEHLRTLVTEGIVKAPALASGGVLLASGMQYATIPVGQDLTTGFVGPADGGYEFIVFESVMLRLLAPDAVCVLKSP
jgi:uncharacterized linocin/CFP29 family protein